MIHSVTFDPPYIATVIIMPTSTWHMEMFIGSQRQRSQGRHKLANSMVDLYRIDYV